MPPLIEKATDKAVTMRHAEILKFEDGKVRQQWVVMDTGAMLMQLGLVEAPKMPEGAAEAPAE